MALSNGRLDLQLWGGSVTERSRVEAPRNVVGWCCRVEDSSATTVRFEAVQRVCAGARMECHRYVIACSLTATNTEYHTALLDDMVAMSAYATGRWCFLLSSVALSLCILTLDKFPEKSNKHDNPMQTYINK